MSMSSQIKILFDEQVIPNYRIGIFKKLALYSNIELTVSFWSHRPENAPPHLENISQFSTVAFDPVKWNYFGRNIWLNLDLFRYILKQKPDVVIGRFNMFGINTIVSYFFECVCKYVTGTKFIYRVSRELPHGKGCASRLLRRIWYKVFYRNAIITTYGQRAADAIIAQGCSDKRVFVEYNSMDTDYLLPIRAELENSLDDWQQSFLELNEIHRPGFVLFASRILPEKRLDLLIEAWKMIGAQFPDAQLVIVGTGTARLDAVEQARPLGDRVVFVPGVYDTKELAKYYLMSSVVVFPGYATLSTHFAMCFGKPIVCSQYGNEVEYVCDGVNGFIYDYGNTRQLAEKNIALLKDDSLRERFGLESECMVRERINVQHMISKIMDAVKATFI